MPFFKTCAASLIASETTLLPALDALKDGLKQAALAARKGAEYTAPLTTAKAGRATYLNPEQLEGHVDPGAEAVARLFEALV